uniref:Uncharacterized protein n=1 Tax=Hanusia phi TaxID=3032 RepID=A0A7S0I2W8_9CRYP
MRGHTDTVRVLAEHGADLFARTAEGFTPMDWAERNGHIDTMLLLDDLMSNCTEIPCTYGKERKLAANGTLLEEKPIRDPLTEYKLLRKLNQDPWRTFSRFEWEGRVMPPLDPLT